MWEWHISHRNFVRIKLAKGVKHLYNAQEVAAGKWTLVPFCVPTPPQPSSTKCPFNSSLLAIFIFFLTVSRDKSICFVIDNICTQKLFYLLPFLLSSPPFKYLMFFDFSIGIVSTSRIVTTTRDGEGCKCLRWKKVFSDIYQIS